MKRFLLNSAVWLTLGLMFGMGVGIVTYLHGVHERYGGSDAVLAGAGAIIVALTSLVYKLHKDAYYAEISRLETRITEGDAQMNNSLSRSVADLKGAMDRESHKLEDLRQDMEDRFASIRIELTDLRREMVTKQDLSLALQPMNLMLTELLRVTRNANAS